MSWTRFTGRAGSTPWLAALLLMLLIAGCATEELRPDYEGARELIAASTGRSEVYDPEAPGLSEPQIEALLADGLSLDEALRLALLNSRRLQAGFMRLGVGRADYVQAGLLENPSLGLSLMFPTGGGRSRLNAGLAQDVMDIWRLPIRRRAAAAEMEQQLLELGRQAGELVVDTRSAYWESVAAHESHVAVESGVDIARRSLEAVRQQVDKGVATETDASLALSLALGADLAARKARRSEVTATRRLASLLSLTDDLVDLALTDPLPDPGPGVGSTEALVDHALKARLDQAAIAAAIDAATERVALERNEAGPQFEAGVEYERPEGDVPWVLGPAVGVELPIFDNNEAQISRAEYELAQLRRLGEAMTAELVQDVRAAVDELAIAQDAASFVAEEVLPQAERLLDLAQRAYAGGSTTLLTLLEAESAALEAHSTGIAARLEAALALVELERALGGPLPAPTDSIEPGRADDP